MSALRAQRDRQNGSRFVINIEPWLLLRCFRRDVGMPELSARGEDPQNLVMYLFLKLILGGGRPLVQRRHANRMDECQTH
jgi:hypothetical protein